VNHVASLGPFNRAFKAATGCTPTAYRAAPRTTPGAVDMLQTDARS
jgi:AraC-like DNA-binding protein